MLAGASAKKRPATTGASASSRKSFSTSSRPIPTHAPTHALRVKVNTRATTSAGMMSAGQVRLRRSNSSRAAALQAISISSPEYVIQWPSVPTGRCCSRS